MKNSILPCLFMIPALILVGCKGDEEAREYAVGLIDVLKTYQAQLEAKAGAEKKAYDELARIYGESADSDLLASLGAERVERGDRQTDALIEGHTLSPSALRDALKDYASLDADKTHDLLFRDSDNYDKYLSNLNKLSVDSDSIDALIKTLQFLSKKRSMLQELKNLKEFGQSARSCLDEMVCKDLVAQLTTIQAEIDAGNPSAERLKVLIAKKADITARPKSTGCDKNPTCPKSET